MSVSIILEGMQFYAFHGCFAEERSIGARFVVDISIDAEYLPAMETDDISQTIDYSAVYRTVKDEMAVTSSLLENVAYRIAGSVIKCFEQAQSVSVKVSKLNPAVGGQVQASSVALSLQRKDIDKDAK